MQLELEQVIGKFVAREGIGRAALVRRMGYRNLAKGLRNLDAWTRGERHPVADQLGRLATALRTSTVELAAILGRDADALGARARAARAADPRYYLITRLMAAVYATETLPDGISEAEALRNAPWPYPSSCATSPQRRAGFRRRPDRLPARSNFGSPMVWESQRRVLAPALRTSWPNHHGRIAMNKRQGSEPTTCECGAPMVNKWVCARHLDGDSAFTIDEHGNEKEVDTASAVLARAGDKAGEVWLWCLHCKRFFQAKDLELDFLGNWQGCPFDDCGIAGLDIDIYLWDTWGRDDPAWPQSVAQLRYGLRPGELMLVSGA